MDVIHDEDFDKALDRSFMNRDFQHLSFKKNKGQVFLNDAMGRRERERKMRETLQSRHGPTAENHDQVRL